jgi:protein tyrosine phosphatase
VLLLQQSLVLAFLPVLSPRPRPRPQHQHQHQHQPNQGNALPLIDSAITTQSRFRSGSGGVGRSQRPPYCGVSNNSTNHRPSSNNNNNNNNNTTSNSDSTNVGASGARATRSGSSGGNSSSYHAMTSSHRKYACVADEFRAVQEESLRLMSVSAMAACSSTSALPSCSPSMTGSIPTPSASASASVSVSRGYASEAGNRIENRTKNRYPDVLPNDAHRVRLKRQASLSAMPLSCVTPSNLQSAPQHAQAMQQIQQAVAADSTTDDDYINASYVYYHTASSNDPFATGATTHSNASSLAIACQAPLPSTFEDFWRMVWEHNSAVIVMLTNLVENDKVKAHLYWPLAEGETQQYGIFSVTLLRYAIYDATIVRCLRLVAYDHTTGQRTAPRTIYHLQYCEWSDMSVPRNTHGILHLLHISSICKQLAAAKGRSCRS